LRTQGDEIQTQIVDIRHLCEELLDKNVDTIKRLNIRESLLVRLANSQMLNATSEQANDIRSKPKRLCQYAFANRVG